MYSRASFANFQRFMGDRLQQCRIDGNLTLTALHQGGQETIQGFPAATGPIAADCPCGDRRDALTAAMVATVSHPAHPRRRSGPSFSYRPVPPVTSVQEMGRLVAQGDK